MNVTVNRNELLRLLAAVEPAVPGRSPAPILYCVALDARDGKLVARTSGLDMHARSSTDQVQIDGEGMAAARHDQLTEAAKAIEDDVLVLTLDGSHLVVKGGRAKVKLLTEDATRMPAWPQPARSGVRWTVPGASFGAAVRLGLLALRKDDKYSPDGLLLHAEKGELWVVGMSGARMGATRIPGSAADGAIYIPRKLLSGAWGELVTIAADDRAVELSSGGMELAGTLLEREVPPWRRLMEVGGIEIGVDRKEVIAALRTASLAVDKASPDSGGVDVDAAGNSLAFGGRCSWLGAADSSCAAECRGTYASRWNPEHLGALRLSEADRLIFRAQSPHSPAVVDLSPESTWVFMVMRRG